MASNGNLDLQVVLDGLGQGVLIFGSDGRLILDNLAARTILGTDINLIRANGWEAATTLFNAKQTNPDEMIEAHREHALQSERPVRFHIFRSGEHLPCWAATILSETGEVCTMITLDATDWSAMQALMDRFRGEFEDAVQSTQGHVDLIARAVSAHNPENGIEGLAKRVTGFTRLINIHMERVGRLLRLLHRLEDVRTGRLRERVQQQYRKINLAEFLEDFLEDLDEMPLVDPETEAKDHRSRVMVDVADTINLGAAPVYLMQILRELMRNAIMYSIKATPIQIKARNRGAQVQIDVVDEGYGIRAREHERVFEEFQRARQPQIISEFGYGLGLYLVKYEVEAMNGRIWFESEENVGTTFSFMLPRWYED